MIKCEERLNRPRCQDGLFLAPDDPFMGRKQKEKMDRENYAKETSGN